MDARLSGSELPIDDGVWLGCYVLPMAAAALFPIQLPSPADEQRILLSVR